MKLKCPEYEQKCMRELMPNGRKKKRKINSHRQIVPCDVHRH